jgi:hypothetical protein
MFDEIEQPSPGVSCGDTESLPKRSEGGNASLLKEEVTEGKPQQKKDSIRGELRSENFSEEDMHHERRNRNLLQI